MLYIHALNGQIESIVMMTKEGSSKICLFHELNVIVHIELYIITIIIQMYWIQVLTS